MAARPAPSLGRGARARILAAAATAFRDPGINASGVAALATRARVSKRTLYQQFASKDELILAWLRAEGTDPGGAALGLLERSELAPRARLLELFTEIVPPDGGRPSVPFVTVAVEIADPSHPARRLAEQQAAGLERRLGDLARAAGARDPERVGRELVLLYVGAVGRTLLSAESDAADEARRLAAGILRSAIE